MKCLVEKTMDDSASVTTSCLAIGEKRPRRTGGCVGIFFQLFDWNRRFSKKKLFSKRLLPPDRAKEGSKLLQIGDAVENDGVLEGDSSSGKNGGETPTLVARLMGLESMPSVQCDKLVKHSSNDLDKKPKPKPTLTGQDFRPKKVQKTGVSDRTSVTRFGAEALHLKNVLSRSRKNHHHHHHHHHPKLVTPVQKTNHQPKRNSSRLVGAATRVLESGLQGRNKLKHAISYGARRPMKGETVDVSSQQASCKNCGNLLDQERESQPQNLVNLGYLKGNPLRADDVRVSLNRSLTGQTRSRVQGKVENGPSQWQKRHIPRNRPRNVPKVWKPDHQGKNGNRNSDGMAFRFGSQMKNRCETPARLERTKNNNNASSYKPSAQKSGLQNPLTRDCLGALVEEKLLELASRVGGYDSKINGNGNPSKRTPAAVFQDLLCALRTERQVTQKNMEFGPKRNHLQRHSRCRYDPNTRFCLQTKLQKAEGLIDHKNGDHLSPGSVLEACFSNDSCCSSSLGDNSGRTQHVGSISYPYDESLFQESDTNPFCSDVFFRKDDSCNNLVVDLLKYISEVLSTIDVNSRITGNTRAHVKHVIFNSELVLSNQMPHSPNELNSLFICDLLLELDSLADVIQTTFGNFLGSHIAGYQLKRFVFDAVIEYLELKYVQYSKCGFRSWINLTLITGLDGLVHELVEEVRGWMGLVGETLDELVEMDMSQCLGKWTDFEVEVYDTGAKIELDILQMLVDEIVVDV